MPVRARAEASRNAIMQAAMALWRTKGYAATSVTEICKAAGVSKALFYVYFARREDILLTVEADTMRDAHQAATAMVEQPYDLSDVIATVIRTLESRTRHYPPELVFETVLESYRLERRAMAEGATENELTFLFLTPFQQAQLDGKFAADVDVARLARIAQVLVSDAIRCWAASDFRDPLRTDDLAREITTLLTGDRI
ncbi:MAG: TetR/AcrR family transcriptional regulator [Nocardia sp.]|nr:TetR/AcrR family transcriptional regulator [Nocardia sp.]